MNLIDQSQINFPCQTTYSELYLLKFIFRDPELKIFSFIFCIFLCYGTLLKSAEYPLENMIIKNPTIPIFGEKMKMVAGYFTILNVGETADKLIGVKADFAKAMIHKSTVDSNGVARMKHLKEVMIPANSSVNFEHGGLHIMFFNLKHPLETMQTKEVTLIFKEAGQVALKFMVEEAKDYSKMKMDHSKDH